MTAAFAIPLMNHGNNTHHGHSYSHMRSHQRSRGGSRLMPPFSLPRIPSERLERPLESPTRLSGSNKTDTIASGLDSKYESLCSNQMVSAPARPHSAQSKDLVTEMELTELPLSAPADGPLNGYAYPGQAEGSTLTAASPHTQESTALPKELLASILLPLPYLLTSYLGSIARSKLASKDGLSHLSQSDKGSNLLDHTVISLGLAALNLCILGGLGMYQQQQSDPGKVGSRVAKYKGELVGIGLNRPTIIGIIRRTLKLALPLLASLELGGSILAFALLATTGTGLLVHNKQVYELTTIKGLKRFISSKSWIVAFMTLLVVVTITAPSSTVSPISGLPILALSLFVYPPPFREYGLTKSTAASSPRSVSAAFVTPLTSWNPELSEYLAPAQTAKLPLIDSLQEVRLTLLTSSLLALITLIWYNIRGLEASASQLLIAVAIAAMSCLSFAALDVYSLRSSKAGGVGTGCIGTLALRWLATRSYFLLSIDTVIAIACYATVLMENRKSKVADLSHSHHQNHRHHWGHHTSSLTRVLLRKTKGYALLHDILSEKDSRRIFYFMILNLSFMLVQSTYGFLTGSLGLISDSVHMFFDCLALLMGLVAAVMSRWPPSLKFPYGYGKIDTLAGFANGIFLMLISVEIVYEAIERLFEGSGLSRTTELLVVSSMGLGVNIVGLLAFEHGHAHHGHSHGGHGHGHDHGHVHSHRSHPVSASPASTSPSKTKQASLPAHNHSHGGENMMGIYLHIMADALGSVAVVISTLLVQYTSWSGFDPLASCIIAILIFASAIPLVASSAKTLLLSLHTDIEYNLRDVLAGVSDLRGVVGYAVPKFWMDDSGAAKDDSHSHHGHSHHHHGHGHGDSHSHSHSHDHHPDSDDGHHTHECSHSGSNPPMLGVIHIIAAKEANLEDVRQRSVEHFQSKNVDILVQVEREEEGRCWCGGGLKSA